MNYRENRSYLNCNIRRFDGTEGYGFPVLEPTTLPEFDSAVGFNCALTEKHPEDKICHFYIDDYQFERVWNHPNKYIGLLSRFKAVLTPDFSQYADFPVIAQMWQHYRKQWCGAYWQSYGIKVIPTIGWGYDWCYDGIPKGSAVSISTVGGFLRTEVREKWLEGYKRTLDVLRPTQILLFGKMFPEIERIPYDGEIVTVASGNLTSLERNSMRGKTNEEDYHAEAGV